MTARIQVRPLTEADVGPFHAAVDAVARESRFLRRTKGLGLDAASEFVRGNRRERNPQVVAMDGGVLVGWCDVVRGSGSYGWHVGPLDMGVLAAWRGKGLGRRLIDATLDDAASWGISRVELTSRPATRGPSPSTGARASRSKACRGALATSMAASRTCSSWQGSIRPSHGRRELPMTC